MFNTVGLVNTLAVLKRRIKILNYMQTSLKQLSVCNSADENKKIIHPSDVRWLFGLWVSLMLPWSLSKIFSRILGSWKGFIETN